MSTQGSLVLWRASRRQAALFGHSSTSPRGGMCQEDMRLPQPRTWGQLARAHVAGWRAGEGKRLAEAQQDWRSSLTADGRDSRVQGVWAGRPEAVRLAAALGFGVA